MDATWSRSRPRPARSAGVARGIAIDGIVWCEQRGPHLLLEAEMDPPGGWVPVVLDAATGRLVER
jgi:hypothetical protein